MSTRQVNRWAIGALALFGATAMQFCAGPPQPAQRTFGSAAEASAALFSAVQKNDQVALAAIFGPDANEIISSGDAAQDKSNRELFVQKYQQMHRVGLDAGNRTTLLVGAENWPMPIPLASKDGQWYFDTAAGKREVLYRRIGNNENAAIRICEELVAAENEYYGKTHDGNVAHEYAQHFVSTPGRHDGLFWQGGDDSGESPIGPLLAFAASEEAAKAARQGRTPFHGYYFRILKAQGASAPGSAKPYIVDGRMTGGVAFLAYPAEYRSSGVMTFIVGPDAVVYQKDFGAGAESRTKAISAFDPDPTWRHAQ
jgi:hypothetical protein